jgi:hypothetical protein
VQRKLDGVAGLCMAEMDGWELGNFDHFPDSTPVASLGSEHISSVME